MRRATLLLGFLTLLAGMGAGAVEPQNQYQCEVYASGTGQVCTYCRFTNSSGGSGQWIVCS